MSRSAISSWGSCRQSNYLTWCRRVLIKLCLLLSGTGQSQGGAELDLMTVRNNTGGGVVGTREMVLVYHVEQRFTMRPWDGADHDAKRRSEDQRVILQPRSPDPRLAYSIISKCGYGLVYLSPKVSVSVSVACVNTSRSSSKRLRLRADDDAVLPPCTDTRFQPCSSISISLGILFRVSLTPRSQQLFSRSLACLTSLARFPACADRPVLCARHISLI